MEQKLADHVNSYPLNLAFPAQVFTPETAANANAATRTQVIEARLARIQARDSGLDLSLLGDDHQPDRIVFAEDLEDAGLAAM